MRRERVTADSFAVTVDLAEYDMARSPELQSLPVRVTSLQQGVEVLEFQPTTVPVALDRLAERAGAASRWTPAIVPEGLAIGTPRTSHEEVTASGPQSQLGRVDRAVARVQIFASGIDVRQPQVPLVPVDIDGREVESVELEPATIQVEIDVRTVETSKTVPIRPILTGNPADGFQVSAVTVEPVGGHHLRRAGCAWRTITEVTDRAAGRRRRECGPASSTRRWSCPKAPAPPRTRPAPVVTVSIRPSIATRTLPASGVTCEGAPDGSACLPQQEQLSVTLRGPAADAGRPRPGRPDADPRCRPGLGPGSHTLTADLLAAERGGPGVASRRAP